MDYKRFAISCIGLMFIGVFCIVSVAVVIDPVGIFDSKIFFGVNNYKFKQGAYLDVFKPYQLAKYRPDVIFIGSSRIYVGWKPVLDGYIDEKVYNLGGSSLSLKDAESYLHCAYEINPPKEVYLGLDFFQFDVKFCDNNRNGFENTRLVNVKGNIISRYISAVSDSMKLHNLLKQTYIESRKKSKEEPLFLRGWDRKRGQGNLNKKEYDRVLESYKKTYKNYVFGKNSLKYIKNIVEEARRHNIKLYVFFNPVSMDMHKLLLSYGHGEELKRLKQEVADISGVVYDFNFVNSYTCNIEELFYDSSHCNMYFAEYMKKALRDKKETEFMKLIYGRKQKE